MRGHILYVSVIYLAWAGVAQAWWNAVPTEGKMVSSSHENSGQSSSQSGSQEADASDEEEQEEEFDLDEEMEADEDEDALGGN